MHEKIPQPPTRPLVGNAPDIDPKARTESWMRLAKLYGPIFRLSLPQRDLIILSSQELVNEVCDEKRFQKRLSGPLNEVRYFTGDGLFTAHNSEENYGKGHRILASAFSPVAIHDMFDGMMDIAEQLILRWSRFGEDSVINVAENFTRATLDTIALCAFDYRFNSFYQSELHPFVNSMVRALTEAGNRSTRPTIQNKIMIASQRQFNADIENMHDIAGKIIEQRKRKGPGAKKDVLDVMLTAKDPVTGEGLSDENIRYQMVTFLIAGHETTSGLLSFALYELLKNPNTLQKARGEVDRVVGKNRQCPEHIPKLTYINQILKETLRLYPPAPAFTVASSDDTILGGKYEIKKTEDILIFIAGLHRDPTVWSNPDDFNPDNFSPEKVGNLPPNAWKPFGNGMRACIGRFFAIQEATLLLAMVLQHFDLIEDNPSYQLKIRESLTIKPENFYIRAKLRGNVPRTTIAIIPPQKSIIEEARVPVVEGNTPLLVLYGSNSGSSESFASRIASESKSQGYISTLATLDEYVGHLPTSGCIVIVTSSYEGHPTDNAKQFVSWIDTLQPNSLNGVKYTVFGCGDTDWIRTYQAIPKKIDQKLSEAGATQIKERGEANAKGDFFGDFDHWHSTLWSRLAESLGKKLVSQTEEEPMYQVEIVKETRSVILRQNDLQPGEIIENRSIAGGTRPKRHIEIALPEGVTYRAGDYLVVLPINCGYIVDRTLKQFGLDREAQIIIHKSCDKQTFLPTGHSVNVTILLAAYVELSQPATRRHIIKLSEHTENGSDKEKLNSLAAENYQNILEKRTSALDLLILYPSIKIPFGLFLEMLPPMRTREYSISSSPLWKENSCTITLSVVDAPAWSGVAVYKGVASNYLAESIVGRKVTVTVHPSNTFHLPGSPDVPIIMVGAGTGIAPFRGFIQERALQIQHGRTVGDALLFFGCPGPDDGYLYREELEEWERIGAVTIRTAFSRLQGAPAKYVQDRLWLDRKEVMGLINKDARIYVCGEATKMAPAVRSTFIKMYQEQEKCTDDEGEQWMDGLERLSVRYVSDVFS